MIYKFNNGRGAVLCGECRKILYEGKNIPEEIRQALKYRSPEDLWDVFCEECLAKMIIERMFLK